MAIKRSAMKEQLTKRLEEQQKGKDKGMNDYETYYTVPNGISQFQTKPTDEGTDYGYDIIPFVVGKNYPTNGYNIKEDQLAYVLDVWVHYSVGAANKPVVCPLKNYGKPCPLCEKRLQVMAEKGQMEKDEYKQFQKDYGELIPKRRVMYNVICRSDEKQEAKGIQLYEVSHFFVEKKLQEAAKRPRGGGLISYPDPDDGKTIWQNFKKVGDNWEVAAPLFEDRNYIITDEEIEAAVQLDMIIDVLDYDEISNIMGSSSVPEPESEPELEEEEYDEPEPPVVNRRSLKPAEPEVDNTPEPEQEEADDVKHFDKPITCPYGGTFITDWDEYEECDNCKLQAACKAGKEEAEKPKPKAPAKRRKVLKK